MRNSLVIYLFFSFGLVLLATATVHGGRKRHASAAKSRQKLVSVRRGHPMAPRRRTFGSYGPPCKSEHGVLLEKWDKIDYNRVSFLKADPRYPNLPSFSTCMEQFQQPSKWGDFFGTRIRTYFVPLQTGYHLFYLSSNGGSELYLSTDDKPEHKAMISFIAGGFPSRQYEYTRFGNQESTPIYLQRGKYYYMEGLMKDDHQNDHFEVGVKTPDRVFYRVIPSKFLWTIHRLLPKFNATYRAILLKVAARAGARAGAAFGSKWAFISGAKAGATAGAMAGVRAGASAGSHSGEKAAIEMTRKTIEDALNRLHGDNLHRFKIILKNNKVVSVIGPGMGGPGGGGAGTGGGGAATAGGAWGTGGPETTGIPGGPGAAGIAGTGGSTSTVTGGSTSGAGGQAGGAAAGTGTVGGGVTGVGVSAETGGGGAAGGVTSEGSLVSVAVGAAGAVIGAGGVGGGGEMSSASGTVGSTGVNAGGYEEHRVMTRLLRPGEDPQITARTLVWGAGGATTIVENALYTVHSFYFPHQQENFTLNHCWRSFNGHITMRPRGDCHVFKARVPALNTGNSKDKDSVSFESACLPGYFIRHRNFHFNLEKRDGTDLFDRESSFHAYGVMMYSRNILLGSIMHDDWYMCQSLKSNKKGLPIVLDFYNGDPKVLARCTFLFEPIALSVNKYENCKDVVGPVKHPSITGKPLPHPPHLIPHNPRPSVLPACLPVCSAPSIGGTLSPAAASHAPMTTSVPGTPTEPSIVGTGETFVALNFINHLGAPFKLFSSLKHEEYLVTGSGFKLKLMIHRPELHSHVTFYAKDPSGERNILLNGTQSISEKVVHGPVKFTKVEVTAAPCSANGASHEEQVVTHLPEACLTPTLSDPSPQSSPSPPSRSYSPATHHGHPVLPASTPSHTPPASTNPRPPPPAPSSSSLSPPGDSSEQRRPQASASVSAAAAPAAQPVLSQPPPPSGSPDPSKPASRPLSQG